MKNDIFCLQCFAAWNSNKWMLLCNFYAYAIYVTSMSSWSLDKICRGLVEDAVFEKGCQDNVSVLLIEFRYDQVAEVDVAGD